ncbi:TOTE conflict system archaeo-eukaryotic primase domain-containing protein [Paenibacillus humicus]|uniref:TOTE conflict system archaeo-eukaryotic primase domain-containing protein n=1 Tax=Paenibacillus humicus TaxID=412861 RepID=UPI003D291B1C
MRKEQELIAKFQQLILGNSNKYIEQVIDKRDGVVRYFERKRKLSEKMLLRHIRGERTVGTFYDYERTKFLCFDVDNRDPRNMIRLYQALLDSGISRNDIHLEDSGAKGWHVWLFFETPLPIDRIVEFGKYILDQLWDGRDCIELRPEGLTTRGIKLPLGIQKKTNHRTVFVDYDLEPLADPFEYFLSIQPIRNTEMEQILQDADEMTIAEANNEPNDYGLHQQVVITPMAEEFGTVKALAEQLIQYGIGKWMTETKRRHYYQFYVILYYKWRGIPKGEIIQKVTEWALKQKELGHSTSSDQEIITDVRYDVESIMADSEKYLYGGFTHEFVIYETDIELARKITNEIERKIYWAILLLGRLFHSEGRFYFSQRRIVQMTGIPKTTVHRTIHKLQQAGILHLVQRGNYKKLLANEYAMPHLLTTSKPMMEPETNNFRELFQTTYPMIS